MSLSVFLRQIGASGNIYIDTLTYTTAFRPGHEITYILQGRAGDQGLNGGTLWSTAGARTAYVNATQSWAAVANLTFRAVPFAYDGTGDRSAYDFVAQLTTTLPSGVLGQHTLPTTGDIVGEFSSSISYFTAASNARGGLSYLTFVHEIGHGIGLLHPHADEPTDGFFPGVNDSTSTGNFGLNQGIFTSLTYNDGYADVGRSPSNDWGWQTGPGALDIAAVQFIYGANNSTATGANTYSLPSLNQAGTGWTAIWDAGGADTISASGSGLDAIINLRAATLREEEGGGGFVSRNAGILGGFTIANGAVIENATGGNGDDFITGNSADNTLIGGAGFDTADYGHATAALNINLAAGTATGDGSDTLTSFEHVIGGAGNDIIQGFAGVSITNGSQDIVKSVTSTNISVASAMSLNGRFSAHTADISIQALNPNDQSVSVRAAGGNTNDYYSFSISAGADITIDIDNSFRLDSAVQLLNAQGNVVASNDDSGTSLDVGSANTLDSFLRYTASTAGTYYIRVYQFASTNQPASASNIPVGSAYTLNVSAANVVVAAGSIVLGSTLDGGAGDDQITGGAGVDTLLGGVGNDILRGGAAADLLFGGVGNDQYFVDIQSDLVFEAASAGTDIVTTTGNFYLYANIENLTLASGAGNIFGVGNALGNTILGNEGENLLIAGGGNDVIRGGAARDAIFGEDGADQIFGDAGIDYLIGGIGDDAINGGDDADEIYGQDGNDTLIGGASFSTDILVGGNGNDILRGDSGLGDFDLLYGDAGDDIFYVDTPADLTFEGAGGGNDTVYANINGAGYYLYANTENLVLQGNTPFGVGNELNNNLTGNAIGNFLLGGIGNDRLNGMEGNDVLFGEAGADTFVFGFGANMGGDVIGDFLRGTDKIDVSAYRFSSFAELQTRFSQVGNNGAISLSPGNFIVLNGVTMSQLTAADFILSAPAAKLSANSGETETLLQGDTADSQSVTFVTDPASVAGADFAMHIDDFPAFVSDAFSSYRAAMPLDFVA
jgi:Ca2+-binding RTX toxin-like protein